MNGPLRRRWLLEPELLLEGPPLAITGRFASSLNPC